MSTIEAQTIVSYVKKISHIQEKIITIYLQKPLGTSNHTGNRIYILQSATKVL